MRFGDFIFHLFGIIRVVVAGIMITEALSHRSEKLDFFKSLLGFFCWGGLFERFRGILWVSKVWDVVRMRIPLGLGSLQEPTVSIYSQGREI